MDLYPLFNSIRISILSTIIVFFIGLALSYYVSKLPSTLKGAIDCVLTLPMVLPPTVIGFLLLKILGPRSALGSFFLVHFSKRLIMVWQASIVASAAVSFPLMYRAARGSFENFDESIAESAKVLGVNRWYIFWDIRVPYCKNGLIAGTVLAFARSLGEYGATSMVSGYTPGRTATISTTVYQLWQTNEEVQAFYWVLLNLAISFVMLFVINLFEKKRKA